MELTGSAGGKEDMLVCTGGVQQACEGKAGMLCQGQAAYVVCTAKVRQLMWCALPR